ncbi:TRAF-interacting protein with FHA domain-containing protein A [Pelodytes ibericus]
MDKANISHSAETEQTLPCLHMTLYHPRGHSDRIFEFIELKPLQEMRADEAVAFGRDYNVCKYAISSTKVSRVQFVLQFYKPLHLGSTVFEIKNVSKKSKLYVDHLELNYLNKVELPANCLIRFGDFQILAEKEEGDSEDKYEISCQVSRAPLAREPVERIMVAIPENGTLNGPAPPVGKSPTAEEFDENEF